MKIGEHMVFEYSNIMDWAPVVSPNLTLTFGELADLVTNSCAKIGRAGN